MKFLIVFLALIVAAMAAPQFGKFIDKMNEIRSDEDAKAQRD